MVEGTACWYLVHFATAAVQLADTFASVFTLSATAHQKKSVIIPRQEKEKLAGQH